MNENVYFLWPRGYRLHDDHFNEIYDDLNATSFNTMEAKSV